jgi:hypothetical protein
MGTVYTEGRHATEGLLSEDQSGRSRDNLVIASGSGIIAPGTVLGKFTSGADAGKYGPSPNAAADPDVGNQTAMAVALYGCDATSADAEIAGITRAAQWKIGDLVFDASVDNDAKEAAKVAQLAAAGIIAR